MQVSKQNAVTGAEASSTIQASARRQGSLHDNIFLLALLHLTENFCLAYTCSALEVPEDMSLLCTGPVRAG